MLAAAGVAVGCGSDDSGGSEFAGGNGGSSASTGTGGSGAVVIGDGGGNGGNGGSGGLDEDAACAADEQEAKLLPLAMFIMLDKSGSMDDNGKWTAAVSALTQFVQDPNSSGIKVALGYFPDGHSCNGAGYDQPDVPMAILPGNAGAIVSSLGASGPSGNTPTEGALNGLVRFCDGYEQANPTEKCIGLLVTDGEPNGCDESPSTLTSIAAGAFGGTPSTLIFTMGMGGADFNLLDDIAQSGGTTQSFDASAGANAFLAALQAIKGAALSCEMLVPVPSQGELDPNQVNVNFIKGDGSIVSLGRVNDAASCVPGAWYYDNNAAPTQIILCPDTCADVQADPNGKIKVLLGCASKPPS
jgi:hypothetical protein